NEAEQLRFEMRRSITQLEIQKEAYRLENSFIGQVGQAIEPLIRPLGFDWKMGISLITGAAAKEIIVSTMGVLYQTTDEDSNPQSLIRKIQTQQYKSGPDAGKQVFSPVVAFAFLIFVLIYFPCVAVVAAVKKETGGWKWALFLVVYTTVLAYVMAFAVFQIGNLLI
nr:ferrous iron transporter B [Bacteroidota bacterium]